MSISVKAYAKINWSLAITGRREDGYHELDSLIQNIELCDELSFDNARWLSLAVNGRALPVNSRNLVIRAANALNEFTGKRRGARITLKKRIPIRAGLGGGSANCAATLAALNALWNLRLPESKLMQIGLQLGADVPFMLRGGLARMTGVGESIEFIESVRRYPILLLSPKQGLSTPEVYKRFDTDNCAFNAVDNAKLATALNNGDTGEIQRLCVNSLEAPAISMLPDVKLCMEALHNAGAFVTRMTGSGSCVFGAFYTDEEAQIAHDKLPGSVFTHTLPLL